MSDPSQTAPSRTSPDLHPLEAAANQRRKLLRLVRMAFFIIIVTVAILNSAQATVPLNLEWYVLFIIAVVFIVAALGIDLATPNKKISTISGVFLGMFAGIIATVALAAIMDLVLQSWLTDPQTLEAIVPIVTTLKVMVGVTLCYLGISTVLQTQDDFRLVIPYVEFAKQIRGPRPLLIDSSALIDARIADLANTGLIQSPVIIPAFVVSELQLLADSSDKMKRAKGRRGLDVIARLQRVPALDVSIDETPVPGKAVDQMLVELARSMPACIVTGDMGLTRVAGIQGVKILNLNDVANALKPSLVPGEPLSVKLLKPGEQAGQAVGYLDDGTMVVAEDGAGRIGQQVTLAVTSTLQTSAGRLIFGRLMMDSGLPSPDAPENGSTATSVPPEPVTERTPPAERPARTPFPPNPPRQPNTARNPRR